MRIQLVFRTWLDEADDDIYFTNEGIYLKMSDFHVGSTFDAKIELDLDAADDLRAALARGYKPVFYAVAVDPDSWRDRAIAHAGPITEDEHQRKRGINVPQ